MIPALHDAEFVRYGVMHRNTFLNSPRLLDQTYADRRDPLVAFAGQMTGVEGYIESAASGFAAGSSAACLAKGEDKPVFPTVTMIGAMANYVSRGGASSFQPMNANFGIIDAPDRKIKGGKKMRYAYYSERALEAIKKADLKISD